MKKVKFNKAISMVLTSLMVLSMSNYVVFGNNIEVSQLQDKVVKVPSDVLDFTTWKVQIPVLNDAGTSVKEISQEQLKSGYSDEYIYLDTDGGVVFWCPVGSPTTANSNYPRTELRELIDGKTSSVNWGWDGTHILTTSQTVEKIPSDGRTTVSQIHGIYPNGDNGPVLVLTAYDYKMKGIEVTVGSEISSNSKQKFRFYGIDLGQRFDTEIKVINGTVYITISTVINGEIKSETFTHPFMEIDSAWGSQLGYFKLGNYVQENKKDYEGEGALVKIYSMKTFHDDSYVEQVAIKSLAIEQQSIRIGVGDTTPLKALFTPAYTTNKELTWSVVEGSDKVVVDKNGIVTALAKGVAKVRATSVENPNAYSDCNIIVEEFVKQEAKVLYEQNFGDSVPMDIEKDSNWKLGSTGTASAKVVKEDSNYVLKFEDNDVAGVAKAGLFFDNQTATTTIILRMRVDKVGVKDPNGAKAQASSIYLDAGGSEEGFVSAANVSFRLRNGAKYQTTGEVKEHRWQLTHSYKEAELNMQEAKFEMGQWKDITLVITPDSMTAGANKTDIYIDGYKVGNQMDNNFAQSYLNQILFYVGTKDVAEFSVDDVKIYAGNYAPESVDAAQIEAITLAQTPKVMAIGDSVGIEATVTPYAAKKELSYSIVSGDGVIAISNKGFVTAVKAGNATVRVASTDNEAVYTQCSFTVVDTASMVPVASLDAQKDNITLSVKESSNLNVDINPKNATEKGISYVVLRGVDVISVNNEGKVMGLKTGVATVRMTSLNNPKAFSDCTVSVVNIPAAGGVIFEDDFSAGKLNLDKWSTATANFNNTVTEVVNGILHLKDDSTAGQPRAYITFEPQASTFSIEFKLKIDNDTILSEDKVSAICAAFGSGTITTTANEAFRFKTVAKDDNKGIITDRRFIYSKEEGQSGFYDIASAYKLDTWYTIKFVTTPNDGSVKANTTDVYVDGVKVIDAAKNKLKVETVDKLIFQTGTADLTDFWIDDVKITAGE